MPVYLSLTDTQVMTTVRQFLLAILPAGTDVIQGYANRVPMPTGPNFVVMSTLRRVRLSTNVSREQDIRFVGSIAGTVLTVTSVTSGVLSAGLGIRNGFTQPNTAIVGQVSGPTGGAGVYTITPTQTVASGVLSGGTRTILQPTQFDLQADIYGPAGSDSAQIVQTLFRDPLAVDYLDGFEVGLTNQAGAALFNQFGQQVTALVRMPMAPLYTSEARNIAFRNSEQQYEPRWTIDLSLQINPEISVPQDFADQIVITTHLVDAADQLAVSVVSVEAAA